MTRSTQDTDFDVLIIGAGAAGLAVAANLARRAPGLRTALIDPAQEHFYQPGWTLVGNGVFTHAQTRRTMKSLIPSGVEWIAKAAASFDPDDRTVTLEDGNVLRYERLVVCPGLKLDWDAVEGLRDALGKNGVTSNYMPGMAEYTWSLVQSLKSGKALFTQPPMPIKCAGAPQKAMYLSADAWKRAGNLSQIDIAFHNAGPALFGVGDYVPALMEYVKDYAISLNFGSRLVSIDGPGKTAVFMQKAADGSETPVSLAFDMIHVCPPQTAPDFIRKSPLANADGWVEVSPETLQHARYADIFALGDACSAPNAKTAAAARAQVPVVVDNLLASLEGHAPVRTYNGYGSCPLTVEKGRIVLAEFGYGGKLLPTFPQWLINGTRPSRLAWFLKERILPFVYFNIMLKGRNWLIK